MIHEYIFYLLVAIAVYYAIWGLKGLTVDFVIRLRKRLSRRS